MTSILYYSNFCDHSKALLQKIGKTAKDVHFICIDRRRQENKKTYIMLDSGKEIIMPDTITMVPALLLLTNYSVIYGQDIYDHLKPLEQKNIQQATQNYMEPLAFSIGNLCNPFGIVSDQYSFVDMEADELTASGSGGMRQLHSYSSLNSAPENIKTPDLDRNNTKLTDEMTLEKIKQMRERDIKN